MLPAGVERHELMKDRVRVLLPARHPLARRHPKAVPLAELAGEAWTTGHVGLGWDEMTRRTCQELGGFAPDVRHRTNDATISLAVVAHGLAVGMLPDLPLPRRLPGVALRDIADAHVSRAIFARHAGERRGRPSTQALLAAVRDAVAEPGSDPARGQTPTMAGAGVDRDLCGGPLTASPTTGRAWTLGRWHRRSSPASCARRSAGRCRSRAPTRLR